MSNMRPVSAGHPERRTRLVFARIGYGSWGALVPSRNGGLTTGYQRGRNGVLGEDMSGAIYFDEVGKRVMASRDGLAGSPAGEAFTTRDATRANAAWGRLGIGISQMTDVACHPLFWCQVFDNEHRQSFFRRKTRLIAPPIW